MRKNLNSINMHFPLKDFEIRPQISDDNQHITRLAQEASMGELSNRGQIFVAEYEGSLVGFIRLLEDQGRWYVNPVIVDSAYRQMGIGRILMEFARHRYGELRFVARGYAVPFYQTLGCENIPWSAVSPIVADDCTDCEMLPTCNPQPMRMPPVEGQ